MADIRFREALDRYDRRADRLAELLPMSVFKRLVPLIEKTLADVPRRTGRLKASAFIKIEKRTKTLIRFRFGWTGFYSTFPRAIRPSGGFDRLQKLTESRPWRDAVQAGVNDALRASGIGTGATFRA